MALWHPYNGNNKHGHKADTYRNPHSGQNSWMMSRGCSARGTYLMTVAQTRNLYGGSRASTSRRHVCLMSRWSLLTTKHQQMSQQFCCITS